MLLAAMALIASAGVATPTVDARPICPNGGPHLADQTVPEAQFKRLDELPPANLELTVLRTEDGCVVPAIVRYGIGTPAKGVRREKGRPGASERPFSVAVD